MKTGQLDKNHGFMDSMVSCQIRCWAPIYVYDFGTYFDNCFQREKKSCASMTEGFKNLLRKMGNFNVIL
jgi:hypothetical protein